MNKMTWQSTSPIDCILFDCDSTLSIVEGITELAKMHGVYKEVHELTEKAMAETGIAPDLYKKRLELVNPKQSDMAVAADIYWNERSQDIPEVIEALHSLGKSVYVVSAGLRECILPFAAKLNIPEAHVFAVSVQFDTNGSYTGFDETSPLTSSTGKSEIVSHLRNKHQRLTLIGDGMNDVEASKAVDRFIGYGGNCYRDNIAKLSPFYLRCASMSAVLPLLLTEIESTQLSPDYQALYKTGLDLINAKQVLFQEQSL